MHENKRINSLEIKKKLKMNSRNVYLYIIFSL